MSDRHSTDKRRASISMVANDHGLLPIASTMEPWQLRVVADDDALAPVVCRNDTVIVDCSERDLIDGEIYAVREDGALKLWLYHHGIDGVGPLVGGVEIGTLSSIAGYFRCDPSMVRTAIPIVGRCVGLLSETNDQSDPLIVLERERQALLAYRDRLLLEQRTAPGMSTAIPLVEFPSDAEMGSPASLRTWLASAMEDPAFAARFALQQKQDALTARLMLVEHRMSKSEATSVEGIQAQLNMLWDVHYAPFPEEQDDLGALTIASARNSLSRLNLQDDHSTDNGDDDADPSGETTIKVLRSPRQIRK